jgi:hypothetical protein
MYMRHKEVYGGMDFILIPGDSAAHLVAERHPGDDPSGARYDAVKQNLKATFDKLSMHFPNTILLPVFGNNDGRVHDNAIDEADKHDYYQFVFDLWFTSHEVNQKHLDTDLIYDTFMAAGFYRTDFAGVTILALNTMYDYVKSTEEYDGERNLVLNWLSYQLQMAKFEGRKVIIMDHIYAGSRWEAERLWLDNYNKAYFALLREFHEQVIIEVVGHDHYSDLRYHSS